VNAAPPFSAKAVDVAVAEFNALRAEINSRMTAQAALVGIGLTAVGVILGLAAGEDGNERLLLAIPAVALLVNTLSAAQTHRIHLLGAYIRRDLWTFLRDQVGDLKCWEDDVAGRRGSRLNAVVVLLIDAPALLLFVAASVLVLAVCERKDWLEWAGWAATVLAVAIPAGVSAWHAHCARK